MNIELEVRSGKIAALRTSDPGAEIGRDSRRPFVAPGFFDIQVNGFAGVDFNNPRFYEDQLASACLALVGTGVTRFCPTLVTADLDQLKRNIQQISSACEKYLVVRQMVVGLHLEGPYISSEDGPRGCHEREFVRNPNWDEFQMLQKLSGDRIKIVTLAPELPGAIDFIRKAAASEVVVALGHCQPEPETIDAAVEAGARLSTHLGNGSHALLPRHANYIQKQMAHDGLLASMICDGHHMPDYFFKNTVRAKGQQRVILITDAMAAAGAPVGKSTLGTLELDAGNDGAVHLPGTPYLAGSALTMEAAVRNAATFAQIPLASAIRMATVNPARLFDGFSCQLYIGERADIVLFNLHEGIIKTEKVLLEGEIIYSTQ